MKEQLKKWWEANRRPAICQAEYLYREHNKPCGHFMKDDFRSLIKEFKAEAEPEPEQKKEVTIIQGGCFHFPKHDEKAVNCFLKVAEYLNPDYAVLTGDVADNSKHSRHCTALDVLMIEALEGKPSLRKFLIALKNKSKKVIYIDGNHENWINQQKEQNISLLYNDEFTVPKILGFDDLDIEHYSDYWEYQDFIFKHGDSIASGDNASKNEFLTELKNGASSHTHKSARYRHTTRTKQYAWYTTGCLCQLKMWYKLPGKSKIASGWNHSFNVFKFIGKQFQCTQVEVIDGTCIYDGKLFEG